jgi:hypothetical protein
MSSGAVPRTENFMWQALVLQTVCGLIALGSIATVAWVLFTGQIGKQGLDALFLLLVCLLFIAIFIPLAVPSRTWKKLAALKPRKGVKNGPATGA